MRFRRDVIPGVLWGLAVLAGTNAALAQDSEDRLIVESKVKKRIDLFLSREEWTYTSANFDLGDLDTTLVPNAAGRALFRVTSTTPFSLTIEPKNTWEDVPGILEVEFEGEQTKGIIAGELFLDLDVSLDQSQQGGTADIVPWDAVRGEIELDYHPAGDWWFGIGAIFDPMT